MSTWSRLMTVEHRVIDLLKQEELESLGPVGDQPLSFGLDWIVAGLLALSFAGTLLMILLIGR